MTLSCQDWRNAGPSPPCSLPASLRTSTPHLHLSRTACLDVGNKASSMAAPRPQETLCATCHAMTSTLAGLRDLASKHGYKHLPVEQLHDSANQGCQFCAILRNTQKKSPKSAAYVRIFSRNPVLQDHEVEKYRIQSEGIGHPFKEAKLDRLQSFIWDDDLDINLISARNYAEVSKLHRLGSCTTNYLYPFTAQGQFQPL